MKVEKNYTYLFQPQGNAHNPIMRFQSPNFAAEISAEGKLGLSRFGFLQEEKFFNLVNFEQLDDIVCNFKITKNGKSYTCTGTEYCYKSEFWYWCAHSKFRIIEAGRFINKVDMMDMFFDDTDLLARFEICTMPDAFTLKFDGYSKTQADGGVEFSLTFPKEYKIHKTLSGIRAIKGENFLGISSNDAKICFDGNTVTFSNDSLGLKDSFKGITAKFYVNADCASDCNVEILSHNQEKLTVARLSDYDFYQIDMVGNKNLDFNIPENRNKCDRVMVKIENPTQNTKRAVLCFAKEGENFPVTGMSPMWRDAKTGEPNGVPVQITKDWHIHPDEKECSEWFAIPLNATRRYLEGKWSHLYSFIEIKPNSTFTGEFVCAFENWGTAPAVSHAQLSLIGWGGYDVWEQLATGSHGENICFQADCSSQAVSFINDIRPLYHAGRHGGYRKYDWSENVGGGELLTYYDDKENRIEFTDILRDFKEQCPVLSNAKYNLVTKDGKIRANLTINNIRTDDVLRIYFNVDYEFLKDTKYSRLSLFQFDSERYQANTFRRLAHGDGATILEDILLESEESFENGYNPRYALCESAGNVPWFYFYDTPEKRKGADYENLKTDTEKILSESKNSTVLLTIRKYDAVINDKKQGANYSVRQCFSSGIRHQAIEINPHTEKGEIKAGSKVSMCVELVLIPSSLDTYYGTCDYLLKGEKTLDTPECALYQVKGNNQEVEMQKGELISKYPIVIKCENDGAKFSLGGGLGYVPMRFENLSTYKGFALYKNGEKVDQSVIGNDFWQTYYDDENGTYSITYSVINEEISTFKLVKEK